MVKCSSVKVERILFLRFFSGSACFGTENGEKIFVTVRKKQEEESEALTLECYDISALYRGILMFTHLSCIRGKEKKSDRETMLA